MRQRLRVVVVGLGIQGKKRLKVAGPDAVATVDPTVSEADYKKIEDVPLDRYDAALVCTPDAAKIPLMKFLLSAGKHALVEKPLVAARPEDLKKLRALSKAKKAACYTAYNHRFEPHIASLKKILGTGELGPVYLTKFFYGNGTARDVKQSPWRDKGMGVVADLGSHLLDMALFLFGKRSLSLSPWRLETFENRACDYAIGATRGKPLLEFEMTLLSWKNNFRVDVLAEKGSAHIEGLCKWGPSTLVVRKRVLPSGLPEEKIETLRCPDPTWEAEYKYFKKLCDEGGCNLENDLWILQAMKGLVG